MENSYAVEERSFLTQRSGPPFMLCRSHCKQASQLQFTAHLHANASRAPAPAAGDEAEAAALDPQHYAPPVFQAGPQTKRQREKRGATASWYRRVPADEPAAP